MIRPLASSAQCRAARALLQWTQSRLAAAAGVARKTVADFELGNRTLHRRTQQDISVALERAGVVWVVDGSGRGEGVWFSNESSAAALAAAAQT